MNWFSRLTAWLWRLLHEMPEEVVREPDPLAEYRRKRERLRRAVAVGDVDEAKRLTKELSGRS